MRLTFALAALLLAGCSGSDEPAGPKGEAVALNAMEAEGTISDAMIEPETILSEGPVDLTPDPAVIARQKAVEAARAAALESGTQLFGDDSRPSDAVRSDDGPTEMDRALEAVREPAETPEDE